MPWVVLALKSLATGVLAVALSLVALLVTLLFYVKYGLHAGPGEAIGWDPVAVFGPQWRIAVLAVPLLIFLVGFFAGFWFFERSLLNR